MRISSTILALIAMTILSACSSMNSSGGTGSWGMSKTSYEGNYFNRPFDPRDPYHGG